MRPIALALAVCTALLLFSAPAANADVGLSSLARTHDMRWARLDPQAAYELSNQSVRIVLRPGDQIAEINGRLETLSAAPYARRGELYVSDADARRLETAAGLPHAAVAGRVAQVQDAVPRSGGSITLDVKPVVGSQAVYVSGRAPAGAPLVVTLYATISRDLPDVLLTRQFVSSDGSGAFASMVPIAPSFVYGSVITVVVTTPPPGPSASARYTVGAPNVTVPLDNLPRNVQ